MTTQSIVRAAGRLAETRSRERPSQATAAAIGIGVVFGLCLAHLMAWIAR